MDNYKTKISDEKMAEILELAAKLSIEKEKNFSVEELVSVGIDAGISPECTYQAIEQIKNQNTLSTQSKVSTNKIQKFSSKQKQRFIVIGTVLTASLIGTIIVLKNEIRLKNSFKTIQECTGKEYCEGRIEALETLNKANISFKNIDL